MTMSVRDRMKAFMDENGSATVEFVILFPLLFGLFLTSVDMSIQMLRQVSLDHAVDKTLRYVRLVDPATLDNPISANDIKRAVCQQTNATTDRQPNCVANLTVELRPVDPDALNSVDTTVRCVNREEDVSPVLEFNPGAQEQELMMVRVCRVSNPFIVANGFLLGNPRGPNDDFMSASVGFFVNEPQR